MPHRREAAEKTHELHEFSLDYCFPGDTGGVSPLTVLVVRERRTRMVLGIVVPRKGVDKPTAKRVVAFIKQLGCEHVDIIVKSDQEPAMKALLREVSQFRSAGGVRVALPDAEIVPDSFILSIDASSEILVCRAIWRKAEEIGATTDIPETARSGRANLWRELEAT